jgi:hypothetical protein
LREQASDLARQPLISRHDGDVTVGAQGRINGLLLLAASVQLGEDSSRHDNIPPVVTGCY